MSERKQTLAGQMVEFRAAWFGLLSQLFSWWPGLADGFRQMEAREREALENYE